MIDLSRIKSWIPKQAPLRSQVLFILLFNSVLLAWLAFKPAPHAVHVAVDDLLCSFGLLLLPLWSLGTLLSPSGRARANGKRTRFWVPLFLSLGTLFYGGGMAVWNYLEVIRHQSVPFPSFADACYLMDYPFLLIAILLIPLRPVPAALRGRVLLDSLMIMTALVTFSWYFLLGPTLQVGGETVLAKVLGPAYPLADLVLLFCVLLLSAHTSSAEMRPVIHLLALGLSIIVAIDTLYGYETLHSTYDTGGIIDVAWPIGHMLVVFAGSLLAQIPSTEMNTPEEKSVQDLKSSGKVLANPISWRSFMPYTLIPFVVGLLWYTLHQPGDKMLALGVYVGSGILIGLILLRQVLTILENSQLNGFLRAAYAELETKNALLEELATTDGLTGLKNHRAFQQQLEQEFYRAVRYGTPLSLLLLDVDRFKLYNDTFGHPAGDEILKKVAAVLLANARDSDFVARYGGEEFVVLLPHDTEASVSVTAERFRAALEVLGGIEKTVTASIGAATMTLNVTSGADLFALADAALYTAKRLGRNRVCVSEERDFHEDTFEEQYPVDSSAAPCGL